MHTAGETRMWQYAAVQNTTSDEEEETDSLGSDFMDEIYHRKRSFSVPYATPVASGAMPDLQIRRKRRHKRSPESAVDHDGVYFGKRHPFTMKRKGSVGGGKRDPSHARKSISQHDDSVEDIEYTLKAYDVEDDAIHKSLHDILGTY